jgi:hypothetical protein
MRKDYDYKTTMELKHHESAAIVDLNTGEVRTVKKRFNNIPEGKEIFEPNALFRKDYTNSWNYLKRVLKPIEFKAAYTLALMAKAHTNSLEPLNDDTTIPELMELLDVSKNIVKPILNKLWDLGVYGKFDIKEADKPYTKYWIFNPYLSFNGRIISSDIARLFSKTHCAKAFNNTEYSYHPKG